MVVDETALILVVPEDTIESVLHKLANAGTARVQLLVTEGGSALGTPSAIERLRQASERAEIDLLLISSDEELVRLARRGKLQTMLVRDAHVQAPSQGGTARADSPYATRVLDREPRDVASERLAADLSAGDAAFLDALDDLDTSQQARGAADQAVDDEIAAALAGLSAALDDSAPHSARGTTADDAFADELDSIDFGRNEGAPAAAPRAETPTAPQRRIRPEDIELTPEELQRASRTSSRASSTPPAPVGRGGRTAQPATQPIPRDTRAAAPARRATGRTGLLLILIVGLLVVLAVIVGVLFFLPGSYVVSLSLPVPADEIETITQLPVPVISPESATGSTAVQAEAIRSDVAFSVDGEITESTRSPSSSAGGMITILSLNPQPILLPAGTEFAAVKADGQEVPFISNSDVLVPAATTSDQGAQIVTTRGQASVAVTARSPGSGSNVDANSIRRMTPPGSPTVSVESGPITIRHDALTGGSEEEVWIVKESDVQRLLGQALAGLDNEARRQIEGLAKARGLVVELTTIHPPRADLERLQGFDQNVTPAIGSPVDPNNRGFTLTVQATYSSLATPEGKSLESQLGGALTEQLRQAGKLTPGDCRAPSITGWSWDETTLFVSGQIGPNTRDPACSSGLSTALSDQVREAIRGKTRAEAEAALNNLVEEGVIGSFTLPAGDRVPGWDWQIRVEGQ